MLPDHKMYDDAVTSEGPLPYTLLLLQAVAGPAESLHNAHCFGTTWQPPENQRNLLGTDFVEKKILQHTEAPSELAYHFSPVIPLQMATAAVALGGEFSALLLIHPGTDGGISRKVPRFVILCHNTNALSKIKSMITSTCSSDSFQLTSCRSTGKSIHDFVSD